MIPETDIYNIATGTKLKPGGSITYGAVNFEADGHFIFTGDFDLQIDEVYNQKDETSDYAYEFLVKSPAGQEAANVNITIGKLCNTVHVKGVGENGKDGEPGKQGADGGKGGDAVDAYGNGGRGADGGSGGKGERGEDGGFAPKITIKYGVGEDAENAGIIVLNKDDRPCDNTSFGGEGGEGGKGGTGGKGGSGGKNGNSKFAPSGKDGERGDKGDKGTTQENGGIKIVLLID